MPIRCAVALEEVKLAMESELELATPYLDTQTGQVVYDEEFGDYSSYLTDLPTDNGRDAFAAALQDQDDLNAEEREFILVLYDLHYGEDAAERFRKIHPIPSRWAYQDMEEFCETVENDVLRGKLEVALDGRGAFRRFKRVLEDYPKARERWFAFKDAKMEHRVHEWLADEAIEIIDADDA